MSGHKDAGSPTGAAAGTTRAAPDPAALVVAVIGGGRWARALAGTLVHNQQRAPQRIARVLLYRPPKDPSRAAGDPPGDDLIPIESDHPVLPARPGAVPDLGSVGSAGTTGSPADAPVDASADSMGPGIVSIELPELAQADLILLASPAATVRGLLRAASPHLHGGQALVHAIGSLAPAKGEHDHVLLISYVVREETPLRRIGALAGPALAPDLEEFSPAALVCGSRYDDVGQAIVDVLASPSLRIYTTQDLIGVEVARAGAAVIAMAAGVASALDLGAPARAILITRGTAEMSRLGVALGGQDKTFSGLAGIGELILATEQRGSADFELGRLLGRGQKLAEALSKVGRVCDGPTMVREAFLLSQRLKLRMPLTAALYRWLRGELDPKQALATLFGSENHSE
jgi:glycerol-3-phosphate dehydrogenase (NAD(P)+)